MRGNKNNNIQKLFCDLIDFQYVSTSNLHTSCICTSKYKQKVFISINNGRFILNIAYLDTTDYQH